MDQNDLRAELLVRQPSPVRILRKAGKKVWVKASRRDGKNVKGHWRIGRRSYRQEQVKGREKSVVQLDVPTPFTNRGGTESDLPIPNAGTGAATVDSVTPEKRKKMDALWKDAMEVDGVQVTKAKAASNIVKVFNSAKDDEKEGGLVWFQNAHDSLAELSSGGTTSEVQAIGIGAVLSAGAAWDQNYLQAAFLIGALKDDYKMDPVVAKNYDVRAKANYKKAMDTWKRKGGPEGESAAGKKPERPALLTPFVGKRPSQVDPVIAAAMVRAESFQLDIRTDPQLSENGKANKVAWNTGPAMLKAVNIYRATGSQDDIEESVDRNIGGQKVRSFFNNINDPDAARDVTIDSHAFGIMLGLPVSNRDSRYKKFAGQGNDTVNGVSGFYPMGADVYRAALVKINAARAKKGEPEITLSQLQSTVWITWRNQNTSVARSAATRSGKNSKKVGAK